MIPPPPETITPLHDRSQFSSGKPALDDWLRDRAVRNQQAGFTAVQVTHVENRIIGFYGLSAAAAVRTSLPRAIRTGQSPEPVPCLLLGQLATDLEWQGKGIGAGLLKHALMRIVQGASIVGCRALLVRALDEDAFRFWLRWGFIPTLDDPMTLARAIPDIAKSLQPT